MTNVNDVINDVTNEVYTLDIPFPVKSLLDDNPSNNKRLLRFWDSIVWAFFDAYDPATRSKGTINGRRWQETLGSHLYNKAVRLLSASGWVVSTAKPRQRWASVGLCYSKLRSVFSEGEIETAIAAFRLNKYLPNAAKKFTGNSVKVGNEVKRTGLKRYGITLAAKSTFTFDNKMLRKYQADIVANATKGMAKVRSKFNMPVSQIHYDEVAKDVVGFLADNPAHVMGLNTPLIDSRGRAILSCQKKLVNPIGDKNARSLVEIPTGSIYTKGNDTKGCNVGKEEVNAVFLFIAETSGWKPTVNNGRQGGGGATIDDKAAFGRDCYLNNTLPNIGADGDSHERIWLERLYAELDRYFVCNPSTRSLAIVESGYLHRSFKWRVPIEIDAGASMLQLYGALLGDYNLLERTNLVGDHLCDPWQVNGLSRKLVKAAAVPYLYGCSMDCADIWDAEGLEFSQDEYTAFQRALLPDGEFHLVNKFKHFLVTCNDPKPSMNISILDDNFTAECNRYHYSKTRGLKGAYFYDTKVNKEVLIDVSEATKVPNLRGFKSYFATLLIHNLDSQIMNRVSEKLMQKYGWVIPIYDAFVVSPAAAADTRKWYCQQLERIYRNRTSILESYFRSIGIKDADGSFRKQKVSYPSGRTILLDTASMWETIMSKVVPCQEVTEFSGNALK